MSSRAQTQRRIFGPKRNEVTGGWRKLHNEELHVRSGVRTGVYPV
jgi:hypothetical protein